jgi:hypothetical protein
VFDGAMGSAQFGAAGSAAAAKAKLLGFMRDKIEVGSPGQFADLTTPASVVDALLLEADDPRDMLDLMRLMVTMAEERVANMAAPVSTSSSSKPSTRTKSEADQARAIFKPGRR